MSESKMTFKDDLREDIGVFVNVTEFGELREVDGVIMPCQMIASTGAKSNRLTDNYDGLLGDFVTLYFRAETYIKKRGRLPRRGEWLYVNDKRFDVESVTNQHGVAKVVLSAYRQNKLRGDIYANPNY